MGSDDRTIYSFVLPALFALSEYFILPVLPIFRTILQDGVRF